MPDWSSLLGNVGSALGSAGQTAGNVLSNPLTQAALASYFGAISAPKHTSTLGRIGLGGLSGLSQYGEAEQQKNRAQLTGAEVDRAKAQAGYDQLQTQAYQNMTPEQRTAAFGGYGGQMYQQTANAQANQAMAGQIQAGLDSGTFGPPTSDTYKRAQTFRGLALKETSKALGPEDLNNFVFKGATEQAKGQAETERAQAQTKEAQYQTGTLGPARADEARAQAEAARARATKDKTEPTVKPKLATIYGPKGETKEVSIGPDYTPPEGWSLKAPGSAKPTDPTVEAGKKIKNLKDARAAFENEQGIWGKHTYGEEDFRKWAISKGINPKTGGALPPLEAGWSYGAPLDDGTPTAVDPNGTPHAWVD